MKWLIGALVSAFLFGALGFAEDTPPKTIVEISRPKPGSDVLGTAAYASTKLEQPFEKKVTEKSFNLWAGLDVPPAEGEKEDPKAQAEKKKQDAQDQAKARSYTLVGQAGEYVGWFGIVRKKSWDEKQQRTELLLQHSYNDGLTDLHIQVTSIYGAGDFRVFLNDKADNIPMLSLVRVYGKVSKGKDGIAELTADYVRVWDWGLFTFMNYGPDKTSPQWKKLRKIDGDDIYTPRPSREYYEKVLGKRD